MIFVGNDEQYFGLREIESGEALPALPDPNTAELHAQWREERGAAHELLTMYARSGAPPDGLRTFMLRNPDHPSHLSLRIPGYVGIETPFLEIWLQDVEAFSVSPERLDILSLHATTVLGDFADARDMLRRFENVQRAHLDGIEIAEEQLADMLGDPTFWPHLRNLRIDDAFYLDSRKRATEIALRLRPSMALKVGRR